MSAWIETLRGGFVNKGLRGRTLMSAWIETIVTRATLSNYSVALS